MSDESNKIFQLLAEIQAKLNAPALNGGFETLMYKVEKIEDTQEKILHEVSDIKETIYDPDTGLFARIKNVENSDSEEIKILEKSYVELQTWKDSEKKRVENLEDSVDEKQEKINEMQKQIEDLSEWKETISKTMKWVVLSIGGVIFSTAGKIIYDYFVAHFHFS